MRFPYGGTTHKGPFRGPQGSIPIGPVCLPFSQATTSCNFPSIGDLASLRVLCFAVHAINTTMALTSALKRVVGYRMLVFLGLAFAFMIVGLWMTVRTFPSPLCDCCSHALGWEAE